MFGAKNYVALSAIALFSATAVMQAAPVEAQGSAASAVTERQKIFKGLKDNMAPLAAIARGKADADKAAMVKSAKNIAALSRKIDPAFNVNTAGSSYKTEARDSIWSNRADFASKASALTSASDKLVAAANTGDKAKMVGALRGVGAACKDCHDKYRDE